LHRTLIEQLVTAKEQHFDGIGRGLYILARLVDPGTFAVNNPLSWAKKRISQFTINSNHPGGVGLVTSTLVVSSNPFESEQAILNSCSLSVADGRVSLVGRSERPSTYAEHVHSCFLSIISSESYPCVGAKGVFNRGTYRFGVYKEIADEGSTAGLCYDLYDFLADQNAGANGLNSPFISFVAAFIDSGIESEMDFHTRLWNQLQAMHNIDRQYHSWDSSVSSDISSPYFAFSFAKQALYVVGLNPFSSRIARRFRWPAIAFNPHSQFRLMREQNTFSSMQSVIRERELALQGSLNPNPADFGTDSEAKQYSGAAANGHLTCPFKARGEKSTELGGVLRYSTITAPAQANSDLLKEKIEI